MNEIRKNVKNGEKSRKARKWPTSLWSRSARACKVDHARVCGHIMSRTTRDISSHELAHTSHHTSCGHVVQRALHHVHLCAYTCMCWFTHAPASYSCLSTCILSAAVLVSCPVIQCRRLYSSTFAMYFSCILPHGKHVISPPWLFKALPLHFSSSFQFLYPTLTYLWEFRERRRVCKDKKSLEKERELKKERKV